MNLSKKLSLVIISAALAFVGCTKKPKRPDPSATVIGQTNGGDLGNGAGGNMGVTDGTTAIGLEQRPEGVIETEDKIIGLLKPVFFDLDKSGIKESERLKLQAAKDYLDKNPAHRVLFEGHCDWRGTSEYNLGLGDRRANSAKKYTESLGVAPAKLENLSKGSQDAKENASDTDMANDRRVEIVILKK